LEKDPSGVESYITGKADFVNSILTKAGWVSENYNDYIKRNTIN
jgi:hypothetical protein